MSNLLKIIGGILIAVGSFFAPHTSTQTLATSFSPVQTPPFFLSGSGINSTQTSTLLTSMEYANGTAVTMADLGSIGYATIDPGSSREEQVSFTGITQNSNGTALITGMTRGLAFNPGTNGCNGSSTLATSHAGAAQFVLSNTACFYTQFAAVANTSTFTGNVTFNNAPTINIAGTNASSAATYGQLASTSFAGVVNASPIQKGIVQEATPAQIASGTGVGSTGADLVIANRNSCLTASTTPCSVVASSTLDPSFLLNASYTLANLTVTATTSIPYIMPVGSIEAYVSSTAPNGWLLCNGSAYSTSSYPALFALIGYTYGSSTGQFLTPNIAGRFISGPGSNTSSTLGATGGATSTQVNPTLNQVSALVSAGGNSVPLLTTSTSITGNNVSTLPPYIVEQYIIKF
jgi:microcystin-dependent protein